MARDRFKDWIVLGSVDMDALVERHCVSMADYERNFKSLKNKGKEAEKLPQYVEYIITLSHLAITINLSSEKLFPCT